MVSTPNTQTGVLCPQCSSPLPYPIVDQSFHIDGQEYRSWWGYCFHCRKGFIAIQLRGLAAGWLLYKYLTYRLINNVPVADGQWIMVTPLLETAAKPVIAPAPPVIQTGPGGDFTNQTDDKKLLAILEKANHTLSDLSKVISEIIGAFRGTRHC
jgi:hypothetical protein